MMAMVVVVLWDGARAMNLAILFHNAGIKSVTNKGNRLGWNLADVNNGDHPDYQQSTPKKRIMAALNDVKNSVLVAS